MSIIIRRRRSIWKEKLLVKENCKSHLAAAAYHPCLADTFYWLVITKPAKCICELSLLLDFLFRY